jgi:hypothetical protein
MTRDATRQDDGESEFVGWDADSDNITVGEETRRGHFHKDYRDAHQLAYEAKALAQDTKYLFFDKYPDLVKKEDKER